MVSRPDAGWETRRKRSLGHDFAIIQLGLPGQINQIEFDTAFFTGNNVPQASVQAFESESSFDWGRKSIQGSAANPDLIAQVDETTREWLTICPTTRLGPGYEDTRKTRVDISSTKRWTHVRLNLYPDGGIARFRVFGRVSRDWKNEQKLVDLASVANGGRAIDWSNSHYGSPQRLLAVARSTGMHDGWETARNPDRPPIFELGSDGMIKMVGADWAIIELGHPGKISEYFSR